MVNFDY